MGIRQLTYLDIPKDLRDQKVREVQSGLRSLLADPTVSSEQRNAARSRSEALQRWADGALPVSDVAAVVQLPSGEEAPQTLPSEAMAPSQHHEVEVSESLEASDGSAEPESVEIDVEPESEE